MRKEDTPSFLAHFLRVRAAPLLDAFRAWSEAHARLRGEVLVTADHLSYKCREVREYDELRGRFEEYADDGWRGCRFLHQSIVSGRRVAVIGLRDGLPTRFGDLRVLELSEPRPMRADPGGFDHVEVYSPFVPSGELARMLERPGERFRLEGRPHHATWDLRVPAPPESGRAHVTIRLTDGPLVEKIAAEMR
jgi:hypothetical protein